MDEVAQGKAALVEETNAAIERSQAQASELDEIVGVYSAEAAHDQFLARAS